MKTLRIIAIALCAAAIFAVAPAGAQERYPSRPIEVVVPWGPGGGADILGRFVAKWLEADLKKRSITGQA